MEYTKGPWIVCRNTAELDVAYIEQDAENLPDGYGDTTIIGTIDLSGQNLDEAEGMANARLIAESPEMFELLQHIVQAADDQDNEDDSDLVECINWERIRAVVARVAGRQVGT